MEAIKHEDGSHVKSESGSDASGMSPVMNGH